MIAAARQLNGPTVVACCTIAAALILGVWADVRFGRRPGSATVPRSRRTVVTRRHHPPRLAEPPARPYDWTEHE